MLRHLREIPPLGHFGAREGEDGAHPTGGSRGSRRVPDASTSARDLRVAWGLRSRPSSMDVCLSGLSRSTPGFLGRIGSHGGSFGIRPSSASCLRGARGGRTRAREGRGWRAAKHPFGGACSAEAHARRAVHGSFGGCASSGGRAIRNQGFPRSASSGTGHWRSLGPPSGGAGDRRRRGTFGCRGTGATVLRGWRSSRRIPFGDHPAAGPRFGLRVGPTGHDRSRHPHAGRRGSAAAFGLRASRVGGHRTFGCGGSRVLGARQTRERFAFPGRSGLGTCRTAETPGGAKGEALPSPARRARQAGT
jgi:hypothetical protein